MMKCLYFLLFVAATQTFATNEVQDSARFFGSRPVFTIRTIFDSPFLGFVIHWNPVSSSGGNIHGYRLIVREETQPHSNQFKIFQDLTIHGQQHSAAVSEIQTGRWYEYTIQARTAFGYGPASAPGAFFLVPHRSDGGRQGSVAYNVLERESGEN